MIKVNGQRSFVRGQILTEEKDVQRVDPKIVCTKEWKYVIPRTALDHCFGVWKGAWAKSLYSPEDERPKTNDNQI